MLADASFEVASRFDVTNDFDPEEAFLMNKRNALR